MTSSLSNMKCSACRRDSPHVSESEIAHMKPSIPDWNLIDESSVPKLDKEFKFKDFETALIFTNAIGSLAEEQGHHPKITTEWGKVSVCWWTHKIRNLHKNDFIMAAKTDVLYTKLENS